MSKYTLLLILNLSFVILGLYKAIMLHRTKKIGHANFIIRVLFWTCVTIVLVMSETIYNFLYDKGLTDSTPLSLADVLLVTGFLACITFITRLYNKVDKLENRVSILHEELSIILSDKVK